ncbi:MAG: DMT family transporter [Leptolyngbyaceae cyanobacterium]
MVGSSFSSAQAQTKETPTLAFCLLLVALVSLSLTAIFVKLSLADISANATLFNRLWIATIIFGAWNGLSELRSAKSEETSAAEANLPTKVILLLVLVAVLHVTGRFFWTWSLTQTSAVKATLMANMPPIFTFLGGWLIFGQRFDRRFMAGMAIALAGAITLGFADLSAVAFSHGASSLSAAIGDAAALLSAVFYAASCLIVEKLRAHLSASTILLGRCFIGLLVMLPIVLLEQGPILPLSFSSWLAVGCLAIICEALGHGLVVYVLRYLSSTFVNVVLLMESALTAVFAYFIFAESLSLMNLLTFTLILGGVLLAKTSRGAVQAIATEHSKSLARPTPIARTLQTAGGKG